jgi:hypothetical protein
MDVGGPDLGTIHERDPDDVRDVARHEPPRDDPAFALGDRRAITHSGHFGEAVDLQFRHREINPGALHEAKAVDPRPRPNELRLHHGQIASHDQKRHPGPVALHRLRSAEFADIASAETWITSPCSTFRFRRLVARRAGLFKQFESHSIDLAGRNWLRFKEVF